MSMGDAGATSAAQSMTSRFGLALNPVFRKGILAASDNAMVARAVRRYGMRLGASRFVAGETLDACIVILKRLNAEGLRVNTTILGEDVSDEAAAAAVADAYVAVLERLAAEQVDGNVALKLTHLGLEVSEEVAFRNVARVVEHAGRLNIFVRIDMEESAWVDPTLRTYRRLRERGYYNVGTVLQAYLYRSEQDLVDLLPLQPNLRLVKGAYLEPDTIAFPRKADVDRNYIRLGDRMLDGGGFTAIATHDERIIEHVITRSIRDRIPTDRFEFQMLYGIRSQRQRELARQGYRVLVATPHGPDWYHYLMRRLAERPANVLFLARNLVRR